MIIRELISAEDIATAYPVMSQLRPHITADDFVPRVLSQRASGYRLVAATDDATVLGVAGFRLVECLAWGRALYVDDLVTDAARRSAGVGQQLFDWLLAHARAAGCQQLHLDSGVQRFDAHRFYLRNRMAIASHHFALTWT